MIMMGQQFNESIRFNKSKLNFVDQGKLLIFIYKGILK